MTSRVLSLFRGCFWPLWRTEGPSFSSILSLKRSLRTLAPPSDTPLSFRFSAVGFTHPSSTLCCCRFIWKQFHYLTWLSRPHRCISQVGRPGQAFARSDFLFRLSLFDWLFSFKAGEILLSYLRKETSW
jgi:hypothetical protein